MFLGVICAKISPNFAGAFVHINPQFDSLIFLRAYVKEPPFEVNTKKTITI